VAMVAARSAAMAFNRVIDAQIDARNPRTRMRAIPPERSLRASPGASRGCCSSPLLRRLRAESALPEAGAPRPSHCLFYSYTKRFTTFSHLVLGLSLESRRPRLGSRFAARSTRDSATHGRGDVLDSRVRRDLFLPGLRLRSRRGLWSVPRALESPLLCGAKLLHILMVAVCWRWYIRCNLGALALAGVGAIVALLIYEHSLVKPADLSRSMRLSSP